MSKPSSHFILKTVALATALALPGLANALDPIDTDNTQQDVIIEGSGSQTITTEKGFGLVARSGKLVKLTGSDLTINSVWGARALGSGARVELGDANTQSIVINSGSLEARKATAAGISSFNGGMTTITTKKLVANLYGQGSGVYGISSRGAESDLKVNADNIAIKVSSDKNTSKKPKSEAFGVYTNDTSSLTLTSNGVINIEVEALGDIEHVLSSGISNNADEKNLKVIGSTINVLAKSTNQASAVNTAMGITTVGDQNSHVTLAAKADQLAFGIFNPMSYPQTHAQTTINGKSIQITAESKDRAHAVYLDNREQDPTSSQTLSIGNANSSVKIHALGKNQANGIQTLYDNAKVVVNGSDLEIIAKSETGSAIGIAAMLGVLDQKDSKSSVTINADNTVIRASGKEYSAAFQATSQGHIVVNGNLDAEADNAIMVRGKALVEINKANDASKTIKLKGNINYNSQDDSTSQGTVVLNLADANSNWTGSVIRTYGSDKPTQDRVDESNVKVSLSNGAQWTPVHVEEFETATEGQKLLSLDYLTLDKGVVNITGTDINAKVDNLSGANGTINLATTEKDGKYEAGRFEAANTKENISLNVNLTNADMSDKLTADDITADQAKDLMANITGNKIQTSTTVPEGFVTPEFSVDQTGAVAHGATNNLMQSSLEIATAAPLALNRILMNDVRKRLGDIRTDRGIHGAWARYDGGKLSGMSGLENKFNTIQAGVDTTVSNNMRLGASFSYTDSDVEYRRGTADMKVYSLALYGTKLFDNGLFADVVGRVAKAESDLTVDGRHKGTLDNWVFGLSGELGWRFDMNDKFYIEPQSELTYTYVSDDALDLSTAHYKIKAANSLLGRVGTAFGLKCPNNKGNVYVRTSVVHEFMGDAKINGANKTQTATYEIDGKDTWFEYGLGANFNLNDATYLWADLERTTGGALDEDWRATLGVRYAF